MRKYNKYERYAAPLSSNQVQEKLNEIIEEGKEIIHYEEKKQETDRFYVTMILGTLENPKNKKKNLLNG